MMTLTYPFGHGPAIRTKSGVATQIKSIKQGDWPVVGEVEKDLNLRDLLQQLLCFNAKSRLTSRQVLDHAFINTY